MTKVLEVELISVVLAVGTTATDAEVDDEICEVKNPSVLNVTSLDVSVTKLLEEVGRIVTAIVRDALEEKVTSSDVSVTRIPEVERTVVAMVKNALE